MSKLGRPRKLSKPLVGVFTEIEKGEYNLLKEMAEKETLSLADIIRRAIRYFLEPNKEDKKGGI